jgi:hypothetical protein
MQTAKVKKLYIDVDGVILTSRHTQPAPGIEEFIDFATKHFDCYWLTSHCKEGDASIVLRLLSQYFDDATMEKLKTIKATDWQSWKTEAIDLDSDFYWLDDHPMRAEMQVLKEHGKLDRLVVVDLQREDELKRIIQFL